MKLDGLNEKQIEAIIHKNGPVLVLAGAGSGKTKVLTNRIVSLIENGVSPFNILAITFTNKAAKEMRERVYNLLGEDAFLIQISTFHAFGLKVLKEYYEKLGYTKTFTILDSDDSLTAVKTCLKELNYDPKIYNPRGVRSKISGYKNEMITPADSLKFVASDYDDVVSKVFARYEKKLKNNNSVDFDDLLLLPIKLFNENKDVLELFQEKYKYLLIDEYQDTNEVQYTLSKMISAKYKNIFVVGDVDQSIFSFRGANYKNILNFEKDYKDAKTIMLEENYRSTPNILNAANQVIKNNLQRKDKKLWTTKEEGKKVQYLRAYDERHEATCIISEIKKQKEDGTAYNDIAVLYRTNAQSRIIEEELLKENIPYKVVGSFYFYNRKEIKDLIAYLKLICNEKDDFSLLRVINEPKRGIGLKSIDNLSVKALTENKSIYEIIEDGKEFEFKKLIERLKEKEKNLSLTELIDVVLEDTGMKSNYENEKTLDSEIRIENLEEFKSITRAFEERNEAILLEDFLNEITLVSDVEEYNDEKDKVTLLTIHSSKGLEFNTVFLAGFEEGIFPHFNAIGLKDEEEEERRLCYVAITRAKEKLYILNAKRRMLYGKDQINQPSRFIHEIGDELLDSNPLVIADRKFNKESVLTNTDAEYKQGDHVMHEKYGEGVVITSDKTIVTVAFSHKHGIVKLMKNHKSLRKV